MRRLSPLLGIVFDGGQGHFSGATLSRDAAKVALDSTSFLGVRIVDVATLTRDAELRAMLTGGPPGRAYVFPPAGRAVEVALATGRVSSHAVVRSSG